MKYINVFYIVVVLCGVGLWQLQSNFKEEILSFYGFAENKETEINFNYSVVVRKIHVLPGQSVKKGTPLLDLYRNPTKENMVDQPFKVATLRAKQNAWQTELLGEVEVLKTQKAQKLSEITASIEKLKSEKALQASLFEGLESLEKGKPQNTQLDQNILALEEEYQLTETLFDQKIANKQATIKAGNSPYQAEINRLESEQSFEANQKVIDIQLLAPMDGVIGDIYCKEAEHFPAFKNLLSFYEPNPSMIKGFIQEDLILEVALQDSFLVRSTKDPELTYRGKVTGLGSRIVEIPERLRKLPNLKTYGREVLISIPSENELLQKEKTILELIPSANEKKSKSLVELR
ncbi:MAG: hypothetical protein AAFP82_02170 [Bacteroidota bacterium]